MLYDPLPPTNPERCIVCRHSNDEVIFADADELHHRMCVLCSGAIPAHIPRTQARAYLFAYIKKHYQHTPHYEIDYKIDPTSYSIILNLSYYRITLPIIPLSSIN